MKKSELKAVIKEMILKEVKNINELNIKGVDIKPGMVAKVLYNGGLNNGIVKKVTSSEIILKMENGDTEVWVLRSNGKVRPRGSNSNGGSYLKIGGKVFD